MARISTYINATPVVDEDKWIGTDYLNNDATKNFTAAAVAKYLNINGKISMGTQMVYQYVPTSQYGPGTMALELGGEDTPFSAVTALTLSITDRSFNNTTAFVDYLVGSDIIINKQKNLLQFGHFKVDSYTLIDPEQDFYTISVSFIGGQGGFEDGDFYNIDNFVLATQLEGDLNFEFTQSTAQSVWNITHNLGKFPSVSIIDSAGNNVIGQVDYTNNNELILTFTAAFAGVAYLN